MNIYIVDIGVGVVGVGIVVVVAVVAVGAVGAVVAVVPIGRWRSGKIVPILLLGEIV